MLFQASATMVPAFVGPDPVTTPGAVPDAALLRLPLQLTSVDTLPFSVSLVLDAPAAESVTVDVYVADDAILEAQRKAGQTGPVALAARKFYLLQAGVTLVGSTLFAVGTPLNTLGTLYLRQTADTLTTSRTVLGTQG